MPSLSNIPEPTTGYRPDNGPPAPHAALPTLAAEAERVVPAKPTEAKGGEEPQQQIDSVSCLLILLIAGGLLRLVLGLFGPLQGVDAAAFERLAEQGRHAFTTDTAGAFPLFDLIAAGLSIAGMPAWIAVAVGSLLTLAAAPAAYVIGRAATGRRFAGMLAAAMVTVHPGVLTAANALSGTALAMGLLTVGLALALHAAKRGLPFAIGGGLLLGLAGLAAPLCWVPAALAGPFVGHLTLSLNRGQARALAYAATVFLLSLAPVAAYRSAFIGTSPEALLVEFNAPIAAAGDAFHPADRALITLTDPSLAELGQALHLPIGHAGKLTANTIGAQADEVRKPDPVADVLADTWLMLNAFLAGLAAVSVGVLLVRRRYLETVVLCAPLVALAFANAPPGEALRLPMIALVGVLAAGLVANRPVTVVDEEAIAARQAAKLARLADKEEKQRAKQDRDLGKHKGDLFAFDKPGKRKKRDDAAKPAQPAGILTARVTDDTSAPARPI